MKRVTMALFLLALLGVAGCGGSDETAETGTAPTAASGAVPFDRAFIDAMVPHHEAAIEMARDAKEAGLRDQELVTIADRIIAAQQAEIDDMLAWREEWFGSRELDEVDTALEVLGLSAQEAGMEHVEVDFATVDDIDQTFASMMTDHHEGAITMGRLAQSRAGHPEIRGLADAIILAQELEIEELQPHAGGEHH
jgi:uncharacterized protein (DUF305 family)